MSSRISKKYYLLIVIIPLICIVLGFGYVIKHLEDEIDLIKREIVGVKKVNEIHNIIIKLQRLRGLFNIEDISRKYNDEKKAYIKEIKKSISVLKNSLNSNEINKLDEQSIHSFLSSITQLFQLEHRLSKEEKFHRISTINEHSFFIQKEIALKTNLIFDDEKNSNMLMGTVVFQLPKLIEYTGQLRALLTLQGKNIISEKEFTDLSNRIGIINDLCFALDFNMTNVLTQNDDERFDLLSQYSSTIESKNKLVDFIYLNFEENSILSDSEKIYEFFTENINSMIELYNLNSRHLSDSLLLRLDEKIMMKNYVVLFGVLSTLFIVFNFANYYRRNNKLIETINHTNMKLKEESISDSLTQLYNRRYFDEFVGVELKKAIRNKKYVSFFMIDIDHFKLYNDTYGHLSGDNVIKVVASVIKNNLRRETDLSFRLGGEEFAIFITDIRSTDVRHIAQKVIEEVYNLNIYHEYNLEYNRVTISIGVNTQLAHHDLCIEDLYKKADDALYKAKENGRNQLCIAD